MSQCKKFGINIIMSELYVERIENEDRDIGYQYFIEIVNVSDDGKGKGSDNFKIYTNKWSNLQIIKCGEFEISPIISVNYGLEGYGRLAELKIKNCLGEIQDVNLYPDHFNKLNWYGDAVDFIRDIWKFLFVLSKVPNLDIVWKFLNFQKEVNRLKSYAKGKIDQISDFETIASYLRKISKIKNELEKIDNDYVIQTVKIKIEEIELTLSEVTISRYIFSEHPLKKLFR